MKVDFTAKQFFCEPFDYDKPKHFAKSQWQKEDKSGVYLAFRWTLVVFYAVCLGFTIHQYEAVKGLKYYLASASNLNLLATFLAMFIGAVLSTLFYAEKLKNLKSMSPPFKFYWFLWTQSLVLAVIITPIYWIFVYDGKVNTAIVLANGTNAIPLLIDLCVVKHPSRIYNFFYMLIVEILYLAFTVIYQFAGGVDESGNNYSHVIFDWKKQPGKASGIAVGVIVASIALHVLFNKVHSIRKKLCMFLKLRGVASMV